MFLIKQTPNLFTLANLVCGCLGVAAVGQGNMADAVWFVLAAGVFDFLDGFLARLLKAHSPIGKDLDSLADMVTFGVLPGFMMFKLLAQLGIPFSGYQAIGLLIPVLSAVRLARFNNDTQQTDSFIGLPTPASALLYSGLALIITEYSNSTAAFWLSNPYILGAIIFNTALLLVAPFRIMAFKFKSYSLAQNYLKYLVLLIALVLLLGYGWVALPFIVFTYILISLIADFFHLPL